VRRALPLVALAFAACAEPGAQPWDLAHDRVIAVRATPPRLLPGERATVDALVTSEADGPAEVAPAALAVPPGTVEPLAGAIEGGEVVGPDDAALAAARDALGLDADAPVPLTVVVTVPVAGEIFAATKTVWLGATAENPALDDIAITGEPVAPVELELAVDAGDDDEVDWLSSSGDISDVDDPVAHLQLDEPGDVTVVVVLRDGLGGVAWRIAELAVR